MQNQNLANKILKCNYSVNMINLINNKMIQKFIKLNKLN